VNISPTRALSTCVSVSIVIETKTLTTLHPHCGDAAAPAESDAATVACAAALSCSSTAVSKTTVAALFTTSLPTTAAESPSERSAAALTTVPPAPAPSVAARDRVSRGETADENVRYLNKDSCETYKN